MQQATVGTKYQIVIPKEIRRKIRTLKPGAKVSVYLNDESSVTIKTHQKDWLERTRGMMTKYWKNVDTAKYLDRLRNEWETKLKEQAKIWETQSARHK